MDMSHDSFYHSERVVNRNYKAAGHTCVHSWLYMSKETGTKTRDDAFKHKAPGEIAHLKVEFSYTVGFFYIYKINLTIHTVYRKLEQTFD